MLTNILTSKKELKDKDKKQTTLQEDRKRQ